MLNMKEIEKKILGIDKKHLLASIRRLKPMPKKLFEGLVRIKYFDFPDHRIHKKRDLLRLREFKEKGKSAYCEFVYKTFKCIKNGCKYYDEMEYKLTYANAFKKSAAFLKELGLIQTVYYEKRRTIFSWGKIKFELDEHPKIPAFLEVEGPSPAQINKAIKALKLEKHEQTADSISALLKRKYPQISLNNLIF